MSCLSLPRRAGVCTTLGFAWPPVSGGHGLPGTGGQGDITACPRGMSTSRQLLREQKVGFLKLARVQAGKRARRAGFHRNGSWQGRWQRQNRQCEPWQGMMLCCAPHSQGKASPSSFSVLIHAKINLFVMEVFLFLMLW